MDSELYEGWDGEKWYAQFVMRQLNPDMGVVGVAIGLAGEVGEILELIKKDQWHGVPMDKAKMVKELGDAKFYLTALQELIGTSSERVAHTNFDKIKARYPAGFVKGGGVRGE